MEKLICNDHYINLKNREVEKITNHVGIKEKEINRLYYNEVKCLFRQWFADEEVIKDLLNTIANLLIKKHIIIFVGEGCNGKSSCLQFIELIYGQVCKQLPENVLSNHINRGGISPLFGHEGKLERGDKIGIIAELCDIEIDDIYMDDIRKYFKSIIITTYDNKYYDRICELIGKNNVKLFEFNNKFLTNPNSEKNDEFLRDIELNEKLKKYRGTFYG